MAVNAHHLADQMLAHLGERPGPPVHCSLEPAPLGTAGALGALRGWLDGRAALVLNGDTYCPAPLEPLLAGWDGQRVRVMVLGCEPLHSRSKVIASLVPAELAGAIAAEPAGLWELIWRSRVADGSLETIGWDGSFADCATVADYLEANLLALAACGVDRLVGPGAVTLSEVRDSVVGLGASV